MSPGGRDGRDSAVCSSQSFYQPQFVLCSLCSGIIKYEMRSRFINGGEKVCWKCFSALCRARWYAWSVLFHSFRGGFVNNVCPSALSVYLLTWRSVSCIFIAVLMCTDTVFYSLTQNHPRSKCAPFNSSAQNLIKVTRAVYICRFLWSFQQTWFSFSCSICDENDLAGGPLNSTPCVFFQIRAITYETRHRHAYRDSLGLCAVRRVGTQEVAVRRLVLGRGHRQQAGVWRDPRVSNAERFKVCWLWRPTGDTMHGQDWTTDVGELWTLVTVVAWCFRFVHPRPSLVIRGFSRTAWGGQRSNVEVTVTKLLSKSHESDFSRKPRGSFFKSGTKHFADKKFQVTIVTTRDKALYQSSIKVFCECLQHVSHRKLLSGLQHANMFTTWWFKGTFHSKFNPWSKSPWNCVRLPLQRSS